MAGFRVSLLVGVELPLSAWLLVLQIPMAQQEPGLGLGQTLSIHQPPSL